MTAVTERRSGPATAAAEAAVPEGPPEIPSSSPLDRLARLRSHPLAVPAACVVLAVLLPLAGGHAISEPTINTFSYGILAGLLALSLNMITGYAGPVSLGQAAFLGVGAFATGLVVTKSGLPSAAAFPVAVVASALVGALGALLVGLPALRLRGIYLALSTFAFADAVDHYFFNLQKLTGLGSGITVPRPHLGPLSLHTSSNYIVVPLLALAVIWVFDQRLRGTRLGRSLIAIRESEEVAASFGVRVPWAKLAAFLASGAVAGLTGALFAYQVTVVNKNSFTLDQSLFYLIIVVVGGLGSRGGVLAAGVLFIALPKWLAALQGWDFIVAALLLVFTLARHPGGFPGMLAEARDKRMLRRGHDDLDSELPAAAAATEPPGPDQRPATGGRLEVTGVTVRFGGLTAVNGAGLVVEPGEAVGLIGPNGAGKSTLFNAISGFVTPNSGRVLLDGEDVTDLPAHERAGRGLGRTFQQVGLVKGATLVENLMLAQHVRIGSDMGPLVGTRAGRAAEESSRARAHELLEEIGLTRYAEVRAAALSTGQQRLVELACAVAARPRLLLLDEPSAGLSPAAAEHLAGQLAALRARHATSLLLIEHHLPLVLAVCERCYVLDAGSILAEGPSKKVVKRPEVVAAYLGEAP
ncbi:MAG TPA: branched-chain amino acid ABC transporter ATP-binding protein/permease [Acidimicrobiales bacterium]|nr:branched-chain amino acid ABC transporter ATP-binding protein/permease [Acidimicrobiales bacterium]